MLCSLSTLNDPELDQIRTLETELGQTLLAFSCHDVQPAIVDDDKLKKIEALEKKLGMSLLAVDG